MRLVGSERGCFLWTGLSRACLVLRSGVGSVRKEKGTFDNCVLRRYHVSHSVLMLWKSRGFHGSQYVHKRHSSR